MQQPSERYSWKLLLPLQAAFVLGLLIWWEMAAEAGAIDLRKSSSPSEIAGVISTWVDEGELAGHILITCAEAFTGYLAGALIGVIGAVVLALRPRAGRVLEPLISALNGMPRLVFVPFFIVWFGFGMTSKAALAAFVVVFLVFFNVYAGMKSISRELVDNTRLLGASWQHMARHLYLPAVMVSLMAGLRVSISFAFAAAVVGEYVGSASGIGYLILDGLAAFRIQDVYAGLAIVLVVVLSVDAILRRVERRSLVWRL